ncbi:MAG: amidase [Alphaproteobacteria bacterium]
MDDPITYDISTLAGALAAGDVTARAHTEATVARIEAHNGALNAFTTVTKDEALAAADESDERRARGKVRGPLDGVPVALKENIDLAGVPTTAGMETRRHAVAEADAVVTARLRAAGAVLLGKLNMEAGAMGAVTNNPHYGATYNPYRAGFTPGGSSGGSGAAVAAGLCVVALGTDTLGSVRIPASYCGVTGLKPSTGLVSTRGVVPLSWRFDHVGPLARSARDLGIMLDALAGYDPESAEAKEAPAADYDPGDAPEAGGVTLGRLVDHGVEVAPDIVAAFDTACAVLSDLGCTIEDVALPDHDTSRLRRAGLLITVSEGAVAHADDLENRAGELSPKFRSALDYGRKAGAADYVDAERRIAELVVKARHLFQGIDVLLTPTTPQTAFSFEDEVPVTQADFTALANLTGAPAVSVPMGLSGAGLPMGLQFTGKPLADATVLRMARVYERAAAWSLRPPGF